MTDEEECTAGAAAGDATNRIGRWHKPWWYTHVQSFLSADGGYHSTAGSYRDGTQPVEFIPLRDWYHRHTKALFWELNDIIPFGNHVVFRWLFGWAVPPKIALIKLTQTEELRQLYEKYHVVQDLLVPLESLDAALNCMHKQFEVYPLWLCPMKVVDHGPFFIQPPPPPEVEADSLLGQRVRKHFPRHGTFDGAVVKIDTSACPHFYKVAFDDGDHEEYTLPELKKLLLLGDGAGGTERMYVDVGAYGNPACWPKPPGASLAVECVRKVEEFVRRVGGFQMLYADSYMSREEFRQMFNHTQYDKLRARFECDRAFPEVYDKISKAARH